MDFIFRISQYSVHLNGKQKMLKLLLQEKERSESWNTHTTDYVITFIVSSNLIKDADLRVSAAKNLYFSLFLINSEEKIFHIPLFRYLYTDSYFANIAPVRFTFGHGPKNYQITLLFAILRKKWVILFIS